MKLLILTFVMLTTTSLFSEDSIRINEYQFQWIDSVEKRIDRAENQINHLSNQISSLNQEKNDKKIDLSIWAILISAINLILIGLLRYYHIRSIKRIQVRNEVFNWKQLITKLIGELIAEIDYPSGEHLQLRLKKSYEFGKNINQLKEILELNYKDCKECYSFLSSWTSIDKAATFKEKLKEVSNILKD